MAWVSRLAFLYNLERWPSKVSLTPDSFRSILMLTLLLVLTSEGHLSALVFIRLSGNHLSKAFEASSNDCITSDLSLPLTYRVLSTGVNGNFNINDNEK